MKSKKKAVVINSDPLALVAEQIKASKRKEKVIDSSESEGSDDELKKITALLAKAFNQKKFYSKPTNNNLRTSLATSLVNKKQEEGHFSKDCKKAKVKDYEYYKTKMLLAKKDKDEQVLLVEDHAWMESNNDSNEEINANMVFMAQIEKVISDSEASSSSYDDKIAEVSYYTSEFESESKYETSNYYDNSTTYGLFVDNNDDQEIYHDSSENFSDNLIESQRDHNESDVTHNDSKDVTKLINQLIKEFDKKIAKYHKRLEKANQQSKDFENQTKFLQKNAMFCKIKQTLLRYSAMFDNDKQHRKQIADQEVLFDKMSVELVELDKQQTSSLKPYVLNVIIEKIIIDLEDEVVNLLEKEKVNLETIESLKSKGFESSETTIFESENQSENDCLVVENECDKEENSKVITPGMFKLSVSQSVSPISMSKISGESNNVESKLKRKRRKRKSSKENVKHVNNDVSRANSDFVYFLDLNTFSIVRRPENSGVIWKKKGSSNTSNVDLSAINLSKLNKNVKRYSRKYLLACNNSHLGETSSAYVCNDAMNVSCNSRMCDLLDDNNFFIFDDERCLLGKILVIL
uniref:Integrase, catalytic region, zinc finger, CCHC-type, peptidase aspartic, catalytic n=1 Tax=Tanacetum cinerariifolium TaxID=118510 RepID=A0A699J8W7_TANCI|nr:hypothetical protein [Tanacetum cinerariifolium]